MSSLDEDNMSIWKNVAKQSKLYTNLKSIVKRFTIDQSYSTSEMNNYLEKKSVHIMEMLTPTSLIVNNFSMNGLKYLYWICYHNPNYQSCNIEYNLSNPINTGLAYALQ